MVVKCWVCGKDHFVSWLGINPAVGRVWVHCSCGHYWAVPKE